MVQAYCYTKYLGHLHLIFDDHGELVTVDTAEVVLLDNNIDKDEMVEERLVKYQSILAPYRQVIGVSNVFLSRNDNSESNLGNLVTDSMLEVWIWEGAQVGDTEIEDIFLLLIFSPTIKIHIFATKKPDLYCICKQDCFHQ